MERFTKTDQKILENLMVNHKSIVEQLLKKSMDVYNPTLSFNDKESHGMSYNLCLYSNMFFIKETVACYIIKN